MKKQKNLFVRIVLPLSFDKMEIAASGAFADRSHSFKTDLPHKPGKGDIIIFAIYLAKFGAAVLYADIMIQAGMEIEVYFFSVAAYPLRFPAFRREVLCHVLLHAHSIHCKNERHARFALSISKPDKTASLQTSL